MTKEKAIAYHEAGHAVMAVYCRVGLDTVSISDGEDSSNVCNLRKLESLPAADEEIPKSIENLLINRMMAALGGIAAEELYLKRKVNLSTSTADKNFVNNCALRVTRGEAEEACALTDYLTLRTKNLLKGPEEWSCVEALVRELTAKKKVSGRRTRKIIKDARAAYLEEPSSVIKD